MTHFQVRRDAFSDEVEENISKDSRRACRGCGRQFVASRAWQKQCSQRCRQRAYACAMAYVAGVTLRAIEASGWEERIAKLETLVRKEPGAREA